LQLAINYILSVPDADRLEKVQQASSSGSYMVQGMQKRLQSVFKDTTLFMALVKLNPYSVLWPARSLTVNTIYNWRIAGAPVSCRFSIYWNGVLINSFQFMEAIIHQGVLSLDLLISGLALPINSSLSHARSFVPIEPIPDVLNARFFEMLDGVYKAHLYEHREFFGLSRSSRRDRQKWAEAMEAYWAQLIKELHQWTVHRKAEIRRLRAVDTTAQIDRALGRMKENLAWIIKGVFNSHLFGMTFPTPAPLLSPAFLLDVSESIIKLKPWLELAWQWIDPYVMSTSANFYSHGTTLALEAAVDRLVPNVPSLQVVWAIASEIFCMRTDALVALRNVDTMGKTSPQPPKYASLPLFEDKHQPKELLVIVMAALKAWRAASSEEVIETRGLRKRDIPEDERFNVLNLPRGAIIFNALTCTYYPWAFCMSRNRITGRLTAVAQKALQMLWVSNHQQDVYSKIAAYWVLRHAMQSILTAQTAGFKGWWDCSEYPFEGEPKMPPSSPSPDAISTRGQLSGQSKANWIHSETEKAIQTIIKILCAEETGAIPVPVDDDKSDYKPFEEVHEAAMALFESMAVASFRAQSIYTDPTQTRLAIVSKKKRKRCLAKFEIPATFEPAPFEVIETYYASFDTDQLSNLDVFGPGSLALEKGKKSAESGKKKLFKSAEFIEEEPAETARSPVKAPDAASYSVARFSSPPVDDDLMFKANMIKSLYDETMDEEEDDD
jgi:hypothetical protein